MLTAVRAVLFDLYGTLFDHPAAVRDVLTAQAGGLNGLVPLALRPRFVDRWQELEAQGLHNRMGIYRQLVHELDLDAGHRRLHPRRLCTEFERAYGARLVPAAGAVETLSALRARGLRLGIVTNGRSRVERATIAGLGLDRLVDDVLISEEVGVRKPDPAIYRQAVQRLGGTADSTLHVGDSHENDVCAASAAGLRVAWLRPGVVAGGGAGHLSLPDLVSVLDVVG